MSSHVRRPKLRGKTGCLNCRSRRKKCDEKKPICDRCSLSGRSCEWPSLSQMVDRRHAFHNRSRNLFHPDGTSLSMLSEDAAHTQLAFDLEIVILRHFIERYYSFLLLPNCHPAFHDGWMHDIQQLMVDDKSLRFSVLANAASHMYNEDSNSGLQSLALKYYSESIKSLSLELARTSDSVLASSDGCLMSIIFLYLHGCMGNGTYDDIPPHLQAAMRVLTLRLFDCTFTMQRPFDVLALESVLYQIFLTSTGLWSDKKPLAEFNLGFWLTAESILESSIIIPDGSASINSPVLGVPVALFRLAVQVKQILQDPVNYGYMLKQVRKEMDSWEALVLAECKVDLKAQASSLDQHQGYYESAGYLYILVISLLLEQTSADCSVCGASQFPQIVPGDTWQIRKAISILKQHEDDIGWSSCYMGNWCVYTLGFLLSEPKDIELVRSEIIRRWESTKFMQNPRFHNDLEAAWTARSTPTQNMETAGECRS